MSKITISRIREDEWVNPFNASAEELLASALEETGLMDAKTQINGREAAEYYQSYCRKRSLFQEATRLGSMLIKEAVITNDQLNAALAEQAKTGQPLGVVLVDLALCSQADIERALARQQVIRQELFELEQAERRRRTIWNRVLGFFVPVATDNDSL